MYHLFLHLVHSQNRTFVVKLLVYTYLYVEIVVLYIKPREESTFHREKAFCGHILHNTKEILSHTTNSICAAMNCEQIECQNRANIT